MLGKEGRRGELGREGGNGARSGAAERPGEKNTECSLWTWHWASYSFLKILIEV